MQLVSNTKVNPLETTVSGYLVCNQGKHSSVITINQFYSGMHVEDMRKINGIEVA